MDSNTWFMVLVYLLSLTWGALGSQCTLTTPNNSEKDLLKKLDPLNGKSLETVVTDEKGQKYKYAFTICGDVDKRENVGMLQTEMEGEKESKYHVVGRYNATQLMGGDNWIMLKYKNGDSYHSHCMNTTNHDRQAHIMITCDANQELGSLKMIEENTEEADECYYLFQISSRVACTKKTEEGLSAGSVFCIIFFIFVLIYLIIGFLYQRIVVGAKGLEQIPNFSFWKEFGKLQADGCDFLCRCGERQEMKMYRGIDDQLLNTERRDEPDDHLLSM